MAIARNGTVGKDTFVAGAEAEAFDGGFDFDTVSYFEADGPVTVDLNDPSQNTGYAAGDTFANIERYFLSTEGDTFSGSDARDAANGGAGDDVMYGRGGNDTLTGDSGNDQLFGNEGHDGFFGGGGDDTVSGGEGNDTAFGDSGNDTLDGNDGDDKLYGGNGNDVLDGGSGNDLLNGDAGNDVLKVTVGDGNNVVNGGTGTDSLALSLSEDTLSEAVIEDLVALRGVMDAQLDEAGDVAALAASASGVATELANLGLTVSTVEAVTVEYDGVTSSLADFLDGLQPADQIIVDDPENRQIEGGDGNDMIVAHFGNDVYVGAEGHDTLDMSMASRAFVDLERGVARGLGRDQVQGVEAVIGSSGNDRLRGDDADNVLTGNAGRDSLSGRSGNDVLDGGDGDDRLSGGSGDDTLVGGEGQDRLNGGSGNDDLSGGDGNDRLWGQDGDDVISDGAGDDRVGGGRGDDVVVAGEGNDFYNGGRGFDTIDFSGSNSALTIDVGRRTATGEDNDRFSSFEKVIGSDFADNMRGSNRVDHLDGGAGDDVIQSLRGADILTGGEGDDTFVFAANDVVRGSRHFGADTITDFEEGDTIDLSGLFRGNDFDAEAVRLTETEVGTVVEAQIGRGGTFVDVVVLDGVFGLDTETITDDGLLVG